MCGARRLYYIVGFPSVVMLCFVLEVLNSCSEDGRMDWVRLEQSDRRLLDDL